jgi:hypothetical protein
MGSVGEVTVDGASPELRSTGLILLSGFGGGAGALTFSSGGVVTPGDLWRAHFGSTAGSGAATAPPVPEPPAVLLAAAGVALVTGLVGKQLKGASHDASRVDACLFRRIVAGVFSSC